MEVHPPLEEIRPRQRSLARPLYLCCLFCESICGKPQRIMLPVATIGRMMTAGQQHTQLRLVSGFNTPVSDPSRLLSLYRGATRHKNRQETKASSRQRLRNSRFPLTPLCKPLYCVLVSVTYQWTINTTGGVCLRHC